MQYVNSDEARSILLNNGLVIIPTETVYGLAGLATSYEAVQKIFEYKNRPADNPLICHFYSKDHIEEYVTSIPKHLEVLIDVFCPGPLTILLDAKDSSLSAAMRGQRKIGCRIPSNEITLDLIKTVGIPLAAPSANPSGMPSSTHIQMAFDYFRDLKGGVLVNESELNMKSEIGIESTIIEYKDDEVIILREGAIGVEEIRSVLPNLYVHVGTSTKTVPGNKYRHYSPNARIIPIADLSKIPSNLKNYCIITTKDNSKHVLMQDVPRICIADNANEKAIAQKLYSTLIEVDNKSYTTAYWYIPELTINTSIGKALQNRLSKIFEPLDLA